MKMKNKKIVKKVPLMFIIMIIIIGILIINSFEKRTYDVSNTNSAIKSKASSKIYGETIEGVNKSGTLETFLKKNGVRWFSKVNAAEKFGVDF